MFFWTDSFMVSYVRPNVQKCLSVSFVKYRHSKMILFVQVCSTLNPEYKYHVQISKRTEPQVKSTLSTFKVLAYGIRIHQRITILREGLHAVWLHC